MKILTVVGARPQFIKAATVSREIRKRNGVHEVLVHTGQHFDANMSEIFLDQMDIPKPDYLLGIAGGNHGAMTGRMRCRRDLKIKNLLWPRFTGRSCHAHFFPLPE